jgi:CRP-like cAMP-binding protein
MNATAAPGIVGGRPRNGFLRLLTESAYARVVPDLQWVTVPAHTVLFSRDHVTDWLYLPAAGVVSLAVPLEDGRAVQAGMVGREGLVGLHAAFDPPLPPFWGGYVVGIDELELWQGRPDRLHDRVSYRRTGDAFTRARLAP